MRQREQELQSAETVKKDRSLGYFHGEAATVASEDAADGYQAASLLAIGADAQDVALLSALSRLPIAFLYTRVPRIIKGVGSRKKTVLTLAAINTLSNSGT